MAVAHIASKVGFDIEAIDDIKVAVSEACTNIILHAQSGADHNYEVIIDIEESNLAITVEDAGIGFGLEEYVAPVPGESCGSGLGIFIIRALMDEVDIQTEMGVGTKIRMSKGLHALSG
jgi:serine/threonine-protein kinase RsbW